MTAKPTPSEGLGRVWGQSGGRTDPDTISPGKVSNGWTAEIPPFQFMNWVHYFAWKMSNHINEEGVPLWDATTSYPLNACTKSATNGFLYRSLIPANQNNEPSTSPSQWAVLADGQGNDSRGVLAPNSTTAFNVNSNNHRQIITCTNAAAITCTVQGATAPFGDVITLVKGAGSGDITVTGSGVTILSKSGVAQELTEDNEVAQLISVAANTWRFIK